MRKEGKESITFKEWVLELLKDERGAVSIKPLIALIGSLILCASMISGFFVEKQIIPSDTLINGIVFITIAAMGGDTIDKFSYKKTDTSQPSVIGKTTYTEHTTEQSMSKTNTTVTAPPKSNTDVPKVRPDEPPLD